MGKVFRKSQIFHQYEETMKRLAIVLILIIVSCKNEIKNEVKTENGVDQTVFEMWGNYTKANPEFKGDEMPEAWFFHNNKTDANRLGKLVVNGKKQAGSSLYAWYKAVNADLPEVGTKNIITNFDGKAIAIIETTKVDTVPFNQISAEYAALDMGTDSEPLEKWKKAHSNFFTSTLKESGAKFTEDMLVVCERFKTIWKKKN